MVTLFNWVEILSSVRLNEEQERASRMERKNTGQRSSYDIVDDICDGIPITWCEAKDYLKFIKNVEKKYGGRFSLSMSEVIIDTTTSE